MENNTITRKKRKRIWPIEIIAGLFIMMIVFFIAVNVDIKTTQETLSDTAHYINEQCNSFTRLNLASETKSLLRVIESAQQNIISHMSAAFQIKIYLQKNLSKRICRNVI